VAAAESSPSSVLVAGIAGLVAGAMSIAAGEYVSVSSQADTERADLNREHGELVSDVKMEHAELAGIYVARGLDEIDPAPGVPRTIAEALGDELTEPHQTVASHGGVGQGSTPMRHGHGGKKDGADMDAERFFRAIDRAVLEHHSRPSGLPLILAALPEHHPLFRRISHNPFLIAEGLTINPDALTIAGLRERAWQVIEPQYQARLAALADEFAVAKSKGLGSDDLAQVAQASAAGRVATLLIESDRQIAGRLDGTTGKVEVDDLRHPQVNDLLDDLGELVGKMGGRVLVIPAERMPVPTGLAATYRF
jgi:hypothetical protein